MPNYLIVGASRGLGFGFLQVLASNPSNTIIGLVRDKAATKKRLATDGLTKVHIVEADMTDRESLDRAAKETEKLLDGKGIDVMINNGAYISQVTAWSTLADLENEAPFVIEDMQKSFLSNVYGVLNSVYAFLPLIRKGNLKKVTAISSGMSDLDFINETSLAVAAPYAISKAALSTLFAKLNAAYSKEGILFMSVCPGFVDTDGVKPPENPCMAARTAAAVEVLNQYAGGNLSMMKPTESATKILALVERSSLEGGHGGSFRSHNGTRRWM